MEKVPLLLIGGRDHNLPPDLRKRFDLTHVELDRETIPPGLCQDAMAVVVLRAVPGRLWDQAQEIALQRGIPIARVESGNDVASHLRRIPAIKKLLDRQHGNGHRTEQEQEKSSEAVTDTLPDIGLDDDAVWKKYGDKLLEGAKLIFNAGEKKHEADFLEELAEFAGIPTGTVKRMLPQLDYRSVLVNIPDSKTWQLLWSSDGDAVEVDNTPVEPKAPEGRKETKLEARVLALAGLHPGPYRSKYQIAQTLALYTDFDTKDGKPLASTPALQVVDKAIEAGFAEEKGGEFFIHQDDSITLTRREEAPPGPPPTPASAPPKVGTPKKGITTVLKKAPPEPKEDVYTDSQIRDTALPPPAVEISIQKLELLKSIIAMMHWDECALASIHKRFDRKKIARVEIDRRLFQQDEWDAYAWETIKKFTFLQAAEALTEKPPEFEDEKCICKDCHEEFIHTKDRKALLFRRFGRASTPRRCFSCHQKHKAAIANEGDVDYDPRLPING